MPYCVIMISYASLINIHLSNAGNISTRTGFSYLQAKDSPKGVKLFFSLHLFFRCFFFCCFFFKLTTKSPDQETHAQLLTWDQIAFLVTFQHLVYLQLQISQQRIHTEILHNFIYKKGDYSAKEKNENECVVGKAQYFFPSQNRKTTHLISLFFKSFETTWCLFNRRTGIISP